MNDDNRSFILAIALSIAVLIGWNAFVAGPRIEQEKQRLEQNKEPETVAGSPKSPERKPTGERKLGPVPDVTVLPSDARPGAVAVPGDTLSQDRAALISATKRILIRTDSLTGSINLSGGRIDDLQLVKYRETTKEGSPPVTLFSPWGSLNAYYAEYGWVGSDGLGVGADTVWEAETSGPLTPNHPVTLKHDNGKGIVFRRTISVDENYMFFIRQEIENTTGAAISMQPYAMILRHGQPTTSRIYILHEGLLGFFGEEGLQEIDYDDTLEQKYTFKDKIGWLGITDKYWAATLVPDQKSEFTAHFKSGKAADRDYFQSIYSLDGVTVSAGGKSVVEGRLFAGAKKADIIRDYQEKTHVRKFDLMIDWGYFGFITRPLYTLLNWLYSHIGNYGLAILATTVLVKLLFFPLANKSYVSMSRMKKLQPEMERIRERFGDDRARQQKAMMELYQKEKINPMSGCLPILLQIPVFFALYKVLYISIEMRHAPFFGWITDLSSPDPTSLFNLFGLIPVSVPHLLMIGVWPLLMGISMWVQMKLNPAPTDPMQQKIFTWMPLFFTFLLAKFPAGLVIYWTWNNILSVTQQSVIMSRQGVKIELMDNIRNSFAWLKRKKATDES